MLLVGLGNPGVSYRVSRHNVGFLAIDRIFEEFAFSSWKKRFSGEFSEGCVGGEKVFLLKPMTYMNLSGQSVGEVLRFFSVSPEDVIVFHDELDFPLGTIKLKTGGGHAGHNGLRSLVAHIGAAFHRVRIGIGHPGDRAQVVSYVLGSFSSSERQEVDYLLKSLAREVSFLMHKDFQGFREKLASFTAS